ncbi:TAXI family TRAP transporter solute-binding subunit [Desulfobacterales bacterium HSG16]|nr:TAXI family TRAP transporter solute-binding subunit [Desulfobacterales bacterium HSG16]
MDRQFIVGTILFIVAANLIGLPGNCFAGYKRMFFYSVGTGDVTGLYYPVGGAITRIVNSTLRTKHRVRLSVLSTKGSVFNINAIDSGELAFALVQSDRQYQAVHGIEDWREKGPQKDIRAMFSIHSESVTLIAAIDSGIRSILDLKGKIVNIGNIGSGHRQNSIDALTASGIDYRKDITVYSEKASKAPKLLQNYTIDAFFYTVGHPNGAIREASTGKRKVRFVFLENIEQILDKYSYYTPYDIPYKRYPHVSARSNVIKSFGVKGTLITHKKMRADVVYTITKEVFERLETIKNQLPALKSLTQETMLEGLSAPFHVGALRYFREKGLIAVFGEKAINEIVAIP